MYSLISYIYICSYIYRNAYLIIPFSPSLFSFSRLLLSSQGGSEALAEYMMDAESGGTVQWSNLMDRATATSGLLTQGRGGARHAQHMQSFDDSYTSRGPSLNYYHTYSRHTNHSRHIPPSISSSAAAITAMNVWSMLSLESTYMRRACALLLSVLTVRDTGLSTALAAAGGLFTGCMMESLSLGDLELSQVCIHVYMLSET